MRKSGFHPNGNPLGYGPAGHFKSGFATSIEMFSVNGTNRLIMHENYGYTIYDLTNPLVPVSSGAQDIESVQGTWTKVGDGFSTVTTATASADGSRALVATRTISHGTLLMKPIGAVFEFGGEFNPSSAGSLVVDHVGSRYLGYSLFGQGSSTALRVADVTNFIHDVRFRTLEQRTRGRFRGRDSSHGRQALRHGPFPISIHDDLRGSRTRPNG